MQKETLQNSLKGLLIVCIIIVCSLADGCSDNPQMNPSSNKNRIAEGKGNLEIKVQPLLPTGHACDNYLLETYQLTVNQDGIMEVWNCCRYVGKREMNYDNPSWVDYLILADNL